MLSVVIVFFVVFCFVCLLVGWFFLFSLSVLCKMKTSKKINKLQKKGGPLKEKVRLSLASSPYSGTRLLQVSNCREQHNELETEINVVDIVFKRKLKFS